MDILGPTILPTTDITGSGGYSSGNYTSFFNGTSCATPYVAGVCGLIVSANPGWSPAQVRNLLVTSATDVVNAADTDPVEAVRELTGGGVAYSFEALGRKETSEQAFRMLRTGGVATIIGMVPQGQMMEIEAAELLYDRKLQGSNMGSNSFRVDMPRFVEFYLDGKLKLDEMISRRIHLDQINEAFDEMKSGEVARSVITFDH